MHFLAPSLAIFLHFHHNGDLSKPELEENPILWKSHLKHLSPTDEELLTEYISKSNGDLGPDQSRQLAHLIMEESIQLRIPEYMIIDGLPVDPILYLTALIQVESSFQYDAVSRSNAQGFMQIKPMTADWIDYKQNREKTSRNFLMHGPVNLQTGIAYLNLLMEITNDIRMTSLSYNAGPNAAKEGRYQESYWNKILREYRLLKKSRQEMQKSLDPVMVAGLN